MIIKKSILHTIINSLFATTLFLFASCNNGNMADKKLPTPKNLTVSSITSDSAVISWDAVENARLYYIRYQAEGYEWDYEIVYPVDQSQVISSNKTIPDINSLIFLVKNSDETYTMTFYNLFCDHNYTVEVSAMPHEEDSLEESNPTKKTFRTLPEVIPEGELKRPENVQIEVDSEKPCVKVSWDAVEGAVYYDIYLKYAINRDYMPDDKVLITRTVPASQTFVEDSSMSGLGDVYAAWYKVAARNSDFSDPCRWSKYKYVIIPRK